MIPDGITGKELFTFLVENKGKVIAAKKAAMKVADAIGIQMHSVQTKATGLVDSSAIKVMAVINTTNYLDSHMDVHMPGIWDKSIKENRNVMHLQEHEMKFDKIISDGQDLVVSAKAFKWRDIGFDYDGQTEALLFESSVRKVRNQYMFEQYAKGNVRNHSVGMQYVKLALAINDPDYKDEFAAWNKYAPQVVNLGSAEYFWAVTEAKVIEGSAVVLGSNQATPTISVEPLKALSQKQEPAVTVTQLREMFKEQLKQVL